MILKQLNTCMDKKQKQKIKTSKKKKDGQTILNRPFKKED